MPAGSAIDMVAKKFESSGTARRRTNFERVAIANGDSRRWGAGASCPGAAAMQSMLPEREQRQGRPSAATTIGPMVAACRVAGPIGPTRAPRYRRAGEPAAVPRARCVHDLVFAPEERILASSGGAEVTHPGPRRTNRRSFAWLREAVLGAVDDGFLTDGRCAPDAWYGVGEAAPPEVDARARMAKALRRAVRRSRPEPHRSARDSVAWHSDKSDVIRT